MPPAQRAFSAPTKTIGFLVDWLDGAYQSQILAGVRDAARDRRVHLLCFSGGILGNEQRGGGRRNATFDLVGPENVDGIILLSGSIGNQVGAERLLVYCERFRDLPRVSVALELAGMASILVDNRTGLESAISHLIRSHGCREIAFVRGPEANLEAELRYDVYRAVLAAHGLPLDPALVASGNFLTESGKAAALELLVQRGKKPDAIVAANDQMALGVLDALSELRLKVPEDIAVVGFDDIEEARFTSPPLTTVRQPLYEQGREAVRLLLSQVYGGARGERVTLHTEFVARRSCRCFAEETRLSVATFPKRASFEAALVERRQIVLADLARAARGALGMLGAGWEGRLISAVTSDLRGDTSAALANAVEDALLKLLEHRADFNLFHDVLTALRRHLLSCLEADVERRNQAEDLFQQARTLIGQVSERAQAQQKLVMSRRSGALARAGAALLSSFESSTLAAAVTQHFPALGIKSCFLSVKRPDEHGSQLAIAYSDRQFPELEAARHRQLDLPRYLLEHGAANSFYVSTVCTEDEVLGYVLLDLGACEGIVYEALREFLSAALRSAHSRITATAAKPLDTGGVF